jgi:hypothetical protein
MELRKDEKVRDTLDAEYPNGESMFTEKRAREILGDKVFEEMEEKARRAKKKK